MNGTEQLQEVVGTKRSEVNVYGSLNSMRLLKEMHRATSLPVSSDSSGSGASGADGLRSWIAVAVFHGFE